MWFVRAPPELWSSQKPDVRIQSRCWLVIFAVVRNRGGTIVVQWKHCDCPAYQPLWFHCFLPMKKKNCHSSIPLFWPFFLALVIWVGQTEQALSFCIFLVILYSCICWAFVFLVFGWPRSPHHDQSWTNGAGTLSDIKLSCPGQPTSFFRTLSALLEKYNTSQRRLSATTWYSDMIPHCGCVIWEIEYLAMEIISFSRMLKESSALLLSESDHRVKKLFFGCLNTL